MLAFKQNDVWVEWTNQLRPLNGGDLYQLVRNAEELFTDADLAAYGLYRVTPAETPEGMVKVASVIVDDAGTPVEEGTFEPLPEPAVDDLYPPLEKWQFEAAIELAGIGVAALEAAIALIPDPVVKITALAKLKNPPGGRYWRSDPLFSNPFLMMQLELTADEINALWSTGLGLS